MPARRRDGRGLRLLVTVTFNENQLRSHLLPLVALDEVEQIVLVADVEPQPLPKMRVIVPPRLLTRLVGRAAAKLLVCVAVAAARRPDWVIGFNLVPHGLNAIITGRVTRTRSLYEMIGGDREWREGGWDSDNAILGRLSGPRPRLERLLLGAVRRSTVVATMGESGRRALLERGLAPDRVRVILPSVDLDRFRPAPGRDRSYDVVTVGALLPNKRTEDLLRAVAVVASHRRDVRVAVVGEGPRERDLRRLGAELEIERNVAFLGFRADVEAVYRDARIFALPSAYEGLSVAMLEAMAAGAVPVVADVGELGSFVRDGETGRLHRPGDVEGLAAAILELLDDRQQVAVLSAAAVQEVRSRASVDAVAATYAALLGGDQAA